MCINYTLRVTFLQIYTFFKICPYKLRCVILLMPMLRRYVGGFGYIIIVAHSGFDGEFVHYLAELFPVMYYKNTCAVIRANAKYNGGLLSGAAGLQNFPSVTY